MKINTKQKIKDLKTAQMLIENAYQDLKNVPSFRSVEYDGKLLAADLYKNVMDDLERLIKLAEGSAA